MISNPANAVGPTLWALAAGGAVAPPGTASDGWPFLEYNTRVVLAGVGMLGVASGAVGAYMLLRKRALVGDALSHATLPGIAAAFLVATALGANGKSLAWLLPGATLSGVLGIACIELIRAHTRLKEDAAIALVLSVFFGAGVALLGLVQQTDAGHAAGLESFIYGKAAAMNRADALLITVAATVCLALSVALAKELRLLCFDSEFAASNGFPVRTLDAVLLAMVVTVTIIGLQAAGLVLMVALMVIPPATARFWTESFTPMVVLSAVLGGVSGLAGAALSAVAPNLPSGAVIVLVSACLFALSMAVGRERGALVRWARRRRLHDRIDLEHVLRGAYELAEAQGDASVPIALASLQATRSWSAQRLGVAVSRAQRLGYVRMDDRESFRLSKSGRLEAQRLTRQHRLWELYLLNFAEVASTRVDRGADDIEHVLDAETIDQLEALLLQEEQRAAPPPSPHAMRGPDGAHPGGAT